MTQAKLWLSGRHTDKYALIDQSDYDALSKYRWHYHDGYATANINGTSVYMHRMVANTPQGMHTDHINHDKLDNRKENLRVVTRFENMQNRKLGNGCVKRLPVNGYVYWIGEVRINGQRIYTVTCKTEEQAKGALKQLIKGLK